MAQATQANWCDAAPASQRAEWAALLGRAFIDGFTPENDRADLETILYDIAADPAVCVRRSLSTVLASSPAAPDRLIRLLARDSDSVATPVVRASPHLNEHDLIELVASERPKLCEAVLARGELPVNVCAAISISADRATLLSLLDHPRAALSEAVLRRIVDEYGDDAEIRGALFDRSDLPALVRQSLVRLASEAVASSPLAVMALGSKKSRSVGKEACQRGTAAIVSETQRSELSTLVDHLAVTEQLSPAVMLRLACSGSLEGLTEALAQLAGFTPKRVRSILVDGRRKPFAALCDRAGLPDASVQILFHAVDVWRRADETGETLSTAEVSARIMSRMADELRAGESGALSPALAFLRGLSAEMSQRPALRNAATPIAAA